MPRILLATDADWIHEDVDAALAGDDIEVIRVNEGVDVRPTVQSVEPELVVLDLQIGNMGGLAACMDLRLDESVGAMPHVPVLILLDRDVDAFMAGRADADGWVVKPLDPMELRRAAVAVMSGGTWPEAPADQVEEPVGEADAEADTAEESPAEEPVEA